MSSTDSQMLVIIAGALSLSAVCNFVHVLFIISRDLDKRKAMRRELERIAKKHTL